MQKIYTMDYIPANGETYFYHYISVTMVLLARCRCIEKLYNDQFIQIRNFIIIRDNQAMKSDIQTRNYICQEKIEINRTTKNMNLSKVCLH